MQRERHEIPDGVMYCKIETLNAVKDYAPRFPCFRFLGVSEQDFMSAPSEWKTLSGIKVFLMDIEVPAAMLHVYRWQAFIEDEFEHSASENGPAWIKVEYRRSKNYSDSYAYPVFTGSLPTYIDIISLSAVSGPAVPRVPTSKPTSEVWLPEDSEPWRLESFHVGQGMCSVFHNEVTGVILDAGAGTPVNRQDYQDRKLVNKLLPLVEKLGCGGKLPMVMSHPDADHWRLLDWDPKILDAIGTLYLPGGTPSLAFKSHVVSGRVHGVNSSMTFRTPSGNATLDVHRSMPSYSDKNGECLVAVCQIGGKRALLAGDYVYRRMAADTGPSIPALAGSTYDAVVVPHHGDEASSRGVFRPTSALAKAFFSAGTHQGYGHPTASSLGEHRRLGYDVVEDHSSRDLNSVWLIP